MIINVSQYNNFLKALIDNEPMLAKVSICGEVSNLRFTDESIFFSLKDAFCQMDCFAYLDKLISGLKNGCEVIVEGSATYLKSGKVSFFVNKITFTEEEGAQFKKLTELKQKLKTLGFFDEDRKKALPKYIFNIGVITSAKGAVLHDIFNVVTRRNKYAKLFLYDVRVQGENASTQIANGIRYLDLQDVDVIIIARGGGSKEDLSAFDSEEIALALRDCSKPTISAVGHETDFSICDFCADLRAGTPSIAAEIVTNFNVDNDLAELLKRLYNAFLEKFYNKNGIYNNIINKLNSTMLNKVEKISAYLSLLMERSCFLLQNKLEAKISEFYFLRKKIELTSPQNALKNGKGLIFKDEQRISEVANVNMGDKLTIYLSDGSIKTTVDEVKHGF